MKFSIKSLFHKKQTIKDTVKQWIMSIEREQNMPEDIVALNFVLFEGVSEPYGIYLTGSKSYSEGNDDWACEVDYEPCHLTCPTLDIPSSQKWDEVLNEMIVLLKEFVQELPDLRLWQVEHITVGFPDGDLMKIK